MIRKFRLTNGAGNGWNLNNRSSFFHSIAGLGFKDGTHYFEGGFVVLVWL